MENKQHIVLIGGGHAHALVVHALGRYIKRNPSIVFTLISDQTHSPYSGLLPSVIAKHFAQDAHLINLPALCEKTGVSFIHARVENINPDARQVITTCGQTIDYDVLSINTGITPDTRTDGVKEFATPVKPIHAFHALWKQIESESKTGESKHIAIVGAGAGGVEVAFAVQHALDARHTVHLLTQGDAVLSGYPSAVQKKVATFLAQKNIQLHTQWPVVRVSQNTLHSGNGDTLHADYILWCASAQPATWLENTGLELSAKGFISINECLQSTSHPNVFAVGDTATHSPNPYPKAGVYAVRQAPVLLDNLLLKINSDAPLKPFTPQKKFLSILALGEQTAIASWPPLYVSGKWVWRWKRYIDLKFMNQFKCF